jgi:hypothetical protein
MIYTKTAEFSAVFYFKQIFIRFFHPLDLQNLFNLQKVSLTQSFMKSRLYFKECKRGGEPADEAFLQL